MLQSHLNEAVRIALEHDDVLLLLLLDEIKHCLRAEASVEDEALHGNVGRRQKADDFIHRLAVGHAALVDEPRDGQAGFCVNRPHVADDVGVVVRLGLPALRQLALSDSAVVVRSVDADPDLLRAPFGALLQPCGSKSMDLIARHLVGEKIGEPSVAQRLAREEQLIHHLIGEELRRTASRANGVHREVHDRVAVLGPEGVLYKRIQAALLTNAERGAVKAHADPARRRNDFAIVMRPQVRVVAPEVVIGEHRFLFDIGKHADGAFASNAVALVLLKDAIVVAVDVGIRGDWNGLQIAVNMSRVYCKI